MARNRWHVAYTLINNPSLIKVRSAAGTIEQIGFGLIVARRPRYNCYGDSSEDKNADLKPLLGTGGESAFPRYDGTFDNDVNNNLSCQ